MTDASRSLAACLRCRRQKLKCGGPSKVPCRRCETAKAQCVFVQPKAARLTNSEAAGPQASDRFAILEQRLDLLEARHRSEIQELQRTVASLTPKSRSDLGHSDEPSTSDNALILPGIRSNSGLRFGGGASAHSTTEEWDQLSDFFYENCRTTIGFMDDQTYSNTNDIRQHSLMSTVICAIAARAVKPEKYQTYIHDADEQIKQSFAGPTPDLLAVQAMMLLTAWTGRGRIWGYIGSVAIELGLNTAALQLGDDEIEHTHEIVERARTWFSICCFDLVSHLNRPFVVNLMRKYLPFAKRLLTSPYSRPVDFRICAYIDGFTIAADAKSQLPKSRLQINPLPQEVVQLLSSWDQRVDRWFYEINNSIEPLYQTFADKQDRNRFMVPYAFLKIYINGFGLHGMVPDGNVPDTNRLSFIQKALDSAVLLLRTQAESKDFRQRLRYTIDYSGITTYHSVNFILNAISTSHNYVDCGKAFAALRQAAQMFEEAGALEAANDLRREQERIALATQTILSPLEVEGSILPEDADDAVLFDIPSFLDAATWDEPFPVLNTYTLD